MPSFKSLKSGLLNRTKAPAVSDGTNNEDSPEGTAARGVRMFCESGSPQNQGEEVLHLPVIVEAAESSPAAAGAAAYQIRKFLSKANYDKPHVQYNSIMLLRILAENPGPSFTKNIDSKFVNTTADLLRTGRDPSVQQILRETLAAFDAERHQDPGLKKLLEMWRMNQGFGASVTMQQMAAMNQFHANQQFGPGSGPGPYRPPRNALPEPVELASRLEESKNTAKILQQLVQSTPTDEVLGNDLIKEFALRCEAAQKSMQGYINCDNPAPDHETMQTLIEINEQLSLSLTRYQRALLSARRARGDTPSNTASPDPGQQQLPNQGGQPVYPTPAVRTNGQSTTPGVSSPPQRTPAMTPEPTQQSAFAAPPGPPPGRAQEAQEPRTQDPFADNAAERSTLVPGDREEAVTALPPPPSQQPVYRY